VNLKLCREIFTEESTTGELFIDGEFYCFTLEDRDRYLEITPNEKIYGRSAIPRGIYNIVIDHSPKFQRRLPHILNVPGFLGVRIHPGNTPEDTEGCILVGEKRDENIITGSVAVFNPLMERIDHALSLNEPVSIEVV
jgi:hypothetical protein